MTTDRRVPPFIFYQLPAIGWACLIFISSSITAAEMPDLSIFRFDKVIHFGVYFVFAFLLYRAFRYQTRFPVLAHHAAIVTIAAVILFGASDEFHQFFVPGRQADIFDLIADTTGAVILVAAVGIKDRLWPPPPRN
jgi:VanZ family protein